MSIRPVDLNGMIQNSQGVGAQKAFEDQKPAMEQQTLGILANKEAERNQSRVVEAENVENSENRYDAKEGQNGGQQEKRKKNKKKVDESVDKVIVKGERTNTFDMTI